MRRLLISKILLYIIVGIIIWGLYSYSTKDVKVENNESTPTLHIIPPIIEKITYNA